MRNIDEIGEHMKDLGATFRRDEHEMKARQICRPWYFASELARDLAIIDVASALRSAAERGR